MFVFCSVITLCYIISISTSDDLGCVEKQDAASLCRTDYYRDAESGSCFPCIGSFGPNCSDPCPTGYFGHGCRRKCTCAVHQECDPKIGCAIKCKQVPPMTAFVITCVGSFGENCSSPCPDGYFGYRCLQICDCNNTEDCDPKSGCVTRKNPRACIHPLQANCSTTCPDGYFGDKCLGICNCAKSQVCDAEIGCVNSTHELDIDTLNFKLETIHIIIVVSGSCGLTLLIGITVYCIRKKRIGRDKNNIKNSTASSPSDSESPLVEDPFVNSFKNCTPTNARLNGGMCMEMIGGHQNPTSLPTRFSTFSTNAHQFNSDLPSECEYHEPWNTPSGRLNEQPRIVKTKTYSSRDWGK